MIDHLGLNVVDLTVSQKFYEEALAPLGYRTVLAFPQAVGLGEGGKPDFWIVTREPVHAGVHVAFACARRDAVDEFYRAALKAGGKDNGAPGIRAHYHANYYGAFVLDPDGNNVEAVCHRAV